MKRNILRQYDSIKKEIVETARRIRSASDKLKQKWKGRKSTAQKRKERSREKKNTGLVDIAKLARAAGMTYGQYVADQYKRGER